MKFFKLHITDFFLLAATTFTLCMIFSYDLWVWYWLPEGSTISWRVYLLSKEYPLIPYLIGQFNGFLFGHLYL